MPTIAPTTVAPTGTTAVVDLVTAPPDTAPASTDPPATEPTTTPTIVLAPAITATVPPPPPPFGADHLTWTAPRELAVVSGHTAPLSVQAHNATARTVSLSHPLACPPRLDGNEMCADIVQLIGAGRSASAQYTIDGRGIAAGRYTLSIEGVLTVSVTVS